MAFYEYSYPVDTNNSMCPGNDDYSNYMFNDQRAVFRSGYETHVPPYFNERDPSQQDSRPRFFWGRGYGPACPPVYQKHDTVDFLKRCGVLKHTLKGLPKDLLRLMEPKYCGLCGVRFTHFDGARIHYISKGHIKYQNKWVIEQPKDGSQRPKENPLKARQLYCELCDVHITSKVHAESHYAGRPHRAIVEGRKVPKNTVLLHKSMQNRVEQLICREKRLLKPLEEVEKVQPDPKSVPPELFCNICKAAVTCSEQMTMHLNGKKHLSKEKRHILNVMKGITTEQNFAETADNGKDAQGAGALDRITHNKQEDESDWGYGTGTWDDDPQ